MIRIRVEESAPEKEIMTTTKEKLPANRVGITHHFTIIAKTVDGEGVREVDGYLTTGEYDDGRLGEIFLKVGKSGDEAAWIDQWALTASVAIQHGASVENLFQKFVATNFEPSGFTKNPEIRSCTSILDYVARYILSKYGRVQT